MSTATAPETATMQTTRKPTILVTDGIHPSACDILAGSCEVVFEKSLSPEALLDKIKTADGLMIRSASRVTAEVLAAAPNLKIVGRAGVGTDNIDLNAATQSGVVVVNSPEGNTIAAAEHTVGMIFAMARKIPQAHGTMVQGQWNRSAYTGIELFGKTLGVIGMGKIGSRVAKACQAMGMKVLVYDPFLSQTKAKELDVTLVDLAAIWQSADFITVHVPKTPETANLLNTTTLAQCKKGVMIVNCARGGVIDEQALVDALKLGHVGAAALDVFSSEPIAADSPFLTQLDAIRDKVVLTPHLGASTQEAQVNVALDVAEQIRDFFEFGFAQSAVNIPTLRKDVLDPVKGFMPLAEVLGHFIRQIAKGAVSQVDIISHGALAQVNTSPLTLAVLKGLFAGSREGVNYVNALPIAEERGIRVETSAIHQSESYRNLITVVVKTDQGRFSVAGSRISGGNIHIVDINGYAMLLEPSPYILLAPHTDQPGMIAQVAKVLGENQINVSAMQVARQDSHTVGGESIMVFTTDTEIPDAVVQQVATLPGITGAKFISL
jgi:D-3-phosphoglycerate dehydrogenase